MVKSTLLVALAAAAVQARKCTNITVPISIEARNAKFNLAPPATEIESTDFFLHFSWQGTNYTNDIIDGYTTVSGDYKLAATYCEPDNGKSDTLQILTHGVGFDRSYWDFPFNHYNYSYVEKAVDQHGYSTLTWDRLGIGASSKGDAVNEIQATLELAALHALTVRAKEGNLCGVTKKFDHLQHAGHSFGSVLTYGFANQYPELTEAIALTGFSQAGSFLAEFALGAHFIPTQLIPALKGKYPPGYVAPKDSVGVLINFFGPGDFDPKLLDVAFATGQPAAVGELLTVAGPGSVKSAFGGRVLVITGERDIPFCGGNCYGVDAINGTATDLLQPSKLMFPKASSFNATVVPNAGHGLNFGYSHTFTYSHILDFFGSK